MVMLYLIYIKKVFICKKMIMSYLICIKKVFTYIKWSCICFQRCFLFSFQCTECCAKKYFPSSCTFSNTAQNESKSNKKNGWELLRSRIKVKSNDVVIKYLTNLFSILLLSFTSWTPVIYKIWFTPVMHKYSETFFLFVNN